MKEDLGTRAKEGFMTTEEYENMTTHQEIVLLALATLILAPLLSAIDAILALVVGLILGLILVVATWWLEMSAGFYWAIAAYIIFAPVISVSAAEVFRLNE
ncbi:MAG: hypothetical protein A2931_01525 [Candidatus Niyogibacteria bacterium RIFCSPLOWO2_01_FULL_45_48]|uniref:Uncharacterized protein n=1 Tax=Candidatus Niyogibacteria bacterium RIFCSPLOWO2_01_FULL_45_48 TaxID=1801724 RepID=A0A1G2EUG5_9BACT|nr:MAG: hypothetical protein A2931_01525 [Candidatus Niyogibacteria bacterium RIFCSPLOWO2_01_FULL_45_48]